MDDSGEDFNHISDKISKINSRLQSNENMEHLQREITRLREIYAVYQTKYNKFFQHYHQYSFGNFDRIILEINSTASKCLVEESLEQNPS
ncbi:hypothetical protein POVCU2_0015670 [Plasmodium ovale curtisi]|nr:hypothetical protein POVCU2_0015670 [Plasmodium ovale curtisi]